MAGVWIVIFLGGFIGSAIGPASQLQWALGVAPCVVGLLVLWATRRSFPLTALAYLGVLGYSLLLMAGGHYADTTLPAPAKVATLLGLSSADLVGLGQVMQGFMVALLAREILVRRRVLARRGWLGFLVLCTSLAVGASGQLLAWGLAVLSGAPLTATLAVPAAAPPLTHLLLTALGAAVSLAVCRRFHDRQLRKFSSL